MSSLTCAEKREEDNQTRGPGDVKNEGIENAGAERQKSTVGMCLRLFAVLKTRLLNDDLTVYQYTGSMAGAFKFSYIGLKI